MVLFLQRPAGKHAVLAWRVYHARVGGKCGPEPSALGVVDPATGRKSVLTIDELLPEWTAGQMMVFFRDVGKARSRLKRRGFPWNDASASNRRFRATEWLLRARKHGEPCAQMVILLERALSEDSCWESPYQELVPTLRGMGEEERASFYDEQLTRLREGQCPPGAGMERSRK